MKGFLFSILTLLSTTGFAQKASFNVDLDSVRRIVIIDHQNFNYEWYCGRVYQITKQHDGAYKMHLIEQYNKPYFFGEVGPTISQDSFDISNPLSLERLNISISQDSAINLANSVVARKHNFWADRIKVENSKDTVAMGPFDESKLHDLVEAINDKRSRSPRYILQNLGMGPAWIKDNAKRLFDSYKLPETEPTKEQRDYCISCFLDKEKAIRASFSLIGSHNTSDYPYVEIQFIQSSDTLDLYTDNPYPLSLPWMFEDSIKLYNPKVSLLIAELLPERAHSNKGRLSGDYSTSFNYRSIEEAFAKSVLYRYCTGFKGKKKRRRKRVYIEEGKGGNK